MAGASSASTNLANSSISNVRRSLRTHNRRSNCDMSDRESSPESVFSTSHSNGIVQETATSDSEFEEHPYSKLRKIMPQKSNGLPCTSSSHWSNQTSRKENSRRSKCMSKSALMARMNRIKKKNYVKNLEIRNTELQAENELLKEMLDRRMKEISSLKREAINLQKVIKNSTEIGSFLKCIHQNTDLQLTSSLLGTVSKDNKSNNSLQVKGVLDNEVATSEEEALVAAVLWGMALHLLCQPYKFWMLQFFERWCCTYSANPTKRG